MKKFLSLLIIGVSVFMIGCETTREITLNKDSSGTLITTTDMSAMISMAKMSGQDKSMDSLNEVIDTTVSLSSMADSLDISAEEKALAKNGKLGLDMNFGEGKLVIKIEFPFSDPAQITKLDKLSSKVLQQTMKNQLGKDTALLTQGGGKMSEDPGSTDDYFITTYSKGMIERKLNKEKYATVGNDEDMNALKEMSQMGVGNSTLIINLPRPAKKAEGKNVKLSDDKKKVTIASSTEDFFDDAEKLEFRIEY